MLRRLWAWLGTGRTRDGYYLRVEGEGGTVEYGVKTWEEFCRLVGSYHGRDREADRERARKMFEAFKVAVKPAGGTNGGG